MSNLIPLHLKLRIAVAKQNIKRAKIEIMLPSPLLFYIYLSDLNSFLANKNDNLKQFQSLASEFLNDDRILIFLELHVLLYADDTVLIAETPENLQKQLDTMGEYCEIWKLCINLKKNKDCDIFQRKS